MNKVIIFEPEVRLNDLYQSVVDSTVNNFEIITFFDSASFTESIEHIEGNISFALIAYDSEDGSGVDILRSLMPIAKRFPVILMCSKEPEKYDQDDLFEFNQCSSIYYKSIGSKELSSQIKTVLKKTNRDAEDLFNNFEYTPVSPLIMLYADSTPLDVYFKRADDEYVRIFASESKVTAEDIQQYTAKGVNKFYIISQAKPDFYDYYLDVLGEVKYKKNPKLEGGNLTVQQQVLGMVFDRLKELGPDQKMLGIAKRNIEANLEMINSTKSLKKLLAKVVGKGEVEFEHSMATLFIGQMILKKLDWKSLDTQYKLSLAAFFHDLFSPKFDDTIKKLESLDEFDAAKIKTSSQDFFNHPSKAAQFVEKLKDIPPDTAQIIATHHELPKGRGFPKKLFGSRTSSLGCVFNTSHYFVLKLYENGWNSTGIEISLTGMHDFFKDGNYEKPFTALTEIFSK